MDGSINQSTQRSRVLLRVLVYELLFGSGNIKGGGGVKREVTRHLDAMRSKLNDIKRERGVERDEDLLPDSVRSLGMYECPIHRSVPNHNINMMMHDDSIDQRYTNTPSNRTNV